MKRKDVEEYLTLHAQAKEIEKRMEELKPEIMEALRNGAHSPDDLPFLLEIQYQARKKPDWKNVAFEFCRKQLGSADKAEKKIAAIEDAFPIVEVECLKVVINRQYSIV